MQFLIKEILCTKSVYEEYINKFYKLYFATKNNKNNAHNGEEFDIRFLRRDILYV